MLVVNTDGACHRNPGPGGWAALWEDASGPMVLLGGEPLTTNNQMELAGPIAALSLLFVSGYAGAIRIRSDAQYVVKGVTEWRSGWERRGWRKAGGEPVKNVELWRELFALVDLFGANVSFEWVRGHNGDPGNEQADRLAQEGLRLTQAEGRKSAWRRTQGQTVLLPRVGWTPNKP